MLWLANLGGALFLPAVTHAFSKEPVLWQGADLVSVGEAVLFFSLVDVCVPMFSKGTKHPKWTNPLCRLLVLILTLFLCGSVFVTYRLAVSPDVVLGHGIWGWALLLGLFSLIAEAFVAMLEHDSDETIQVTLTIRLERD